jgi:hypothetical protein
MIRTKLKWILSLNGISLLLGIIGGVFGLMSVFLESWNYQISAKWFAFLIMVTLFIILVLGKLAYEFYTHASIKPTTDARVIRYLPQNPTMLISKHTGFEYAARVTIFHTNNNIQLPLAEGYVENIQDSFIQVKIIKFDDEFVASYPSIIELIDNNNEAILSTLIVKNYIRYI